MLCTIDQEGRTPIYLAVEGNRSETASMLLEVVGKNLPPALKNKTFDQMWKNRSKGQRRDSPFKSTRTVPTLQ